MKTSNLTSTEWKAPGSVRREGEPLPSRRALMDRLDRVQAALRKETWLPSGFRALLVQELPLIRSALGSHNRGRKSRIAAKVHELALTSFRYGPELLDSEAIVQLRVLDLELNPLRMSTRELAELPDDDGA